MQSQNPRMVDQLAVTFCVIFIDVRSLTYRSSVTPNGVNESTLARKWLVAWRHQTIISTNAGKSPVKSYSIHIRAISQDMLKISILYLSLKITYLKLQLHLSGGNELIVVECKATKAQLFFVLFCFVFRFRSRSQVFFSKQEPSIYQSAHLKYAPRKFKPTDAPKLSYTNNVNSTQRLKITNSSLQLSWCIN